MVTNDDLVNASSSVMKQGDRYGRYTVLGIFQREFGYQKYAKVQCDCGSPPRFVQIGTLRNGESQSCGCLHKEKITKHGAWKHPLFKVWRGMMERCYDPKNKRYNRYGGRGITVCERWQDVNAFIQDMSASHRKGLTIDRIDNDKGYYPENCRWTTQKQQTRNKSSNVIIEHDGKRQCLADWASELGMTYGTLHDRIRQGWTVHRALTTPVMSNSESGRLAGHASVQKKRNKIK